MLDTKSSTPFAIAAASVNWEQVPILIAAFLPVEICVYYQVVPVNLDGTLLILGMVDPNDLAAQDYVGKMLEFSHLQVHPHPISFEEHQELIAYYFSHPPDPTSIAAVKNAAVGVVEEAELAEASLTSTASPAEDTEDTVEPSVNSTSEADIKRLLSSVLRRAIEEKADRVFIEVNENRTCRIRYRQKGILRELFRDLSATVGSELILQLKHMVGLSPGPESSDREAEAERVFRGEPLILQLRIVPQHQREGAILTLVRGEAFAKHQLRRNSERVEEVTELSTQTRALLAQLQGQLTDTIEKVRQYSQHPNEHWQLLADSLADLVDQAKQVEHLHHEWLDVQDSKQSPS
ncbi:MAG: hypothetical protein AAF704_10030 [Cyanobacteria bacterium P01_D01_bin.123]